MSKQELYVGNFNYSMPQAWNRILYSDTEYDFLKNASKKVCKKNGHRYNLTGQNRSAEKEVKTECLSDEIIASIKGI